jgi:hypothetical protein
MSGLISTRNRVAIKPFVISRKAWLINQTVNGAHVSAVLFSIIETAKANWLMPFNYLMQLLPQQSHPAPDVEKLPPWNIKLG